MSIRDDFNALRFDPAHHLGLGDIRLTLAQQEEIAARAEAAEADARRYRWLRHGDNDERVLQFYDTDNCGTDDCWLLRGEDLDAAIDAELAKEAGAMIRPSDIGLTPKWPEKL